MRAAGVALSLALVGGCEVLQFEEARRPWTVLFDGETLDGWTTVGGRYDGTAPWTVEDGAITGREGPDGEGGLIYTERDYADFELELEAKVDYPFDSGIFLRMRPPSTGEKGPQVTIDYRPKGEVGGIYADGYLLHNETGKEAFRRDAWNRFYVRCEGADVHLTVYMNGELLTDYRMPAGTPGYARSGKIGLQVHPAMNAPEGNKVQFRDIRIRELPPFEAGPDGALVVTAAGRALGWEPLFDGATLAGWEPDGGDEGFAVEDGAMVFYPGPGGDHLATTEDFRDFELRLDFQIARLANSGVFLRAARDGSNPAYSGCEVQILDDFDWEEATGTKLQPYQFTGSLYGAVPAGHPGTLRPVGEWNTYEITYVGSRLRTVLNGVVLYDVDTLELKVDPPFASRAPEGFIGLQRHAPADAVEGPYVRFRNVFVRRL